MTQLRSILQHLESVAPASLQESYDNSGLLVGNPDMAVTGAIISLDCTEAVIDEAVRAGFNLVISHHPVLFSGLKRLTGRNYVERTIMKAIRENVAIYAIHTNLDNVRNGVNQKIAEKLSIVNGRVLAPKKGFLRKLVTFCPTSHAEALRSALFTAGAGTIGQYDECGFTLQGTGTFRSLAGSNPFLGEKGKRHHEPEERLEVIYEAWKEQAVLNAMRSNHPYEEVAYDLYSLENEHASVGSGWVGELEQPLDEAVFLQFLKQTMGASVVRHTRLLGKKVQKIAVCGGSGSFLLQEAKKSGAQVFVTADYKYHQFFDAESDIVIADIGHYESEQFTMELLHDLILQNFSTFAVRLTGVETNPVKYL